MQSRSCRLRALGAPPRQRCSSERDVCDRVALLWLVHGASFAEFPSSVALGFVALAPFAFNLDLGWRRSLVAAKGVRVVARHIETSCVRRAEVQDRRSQCSVVCGPFCGEIDRPRPRGEPPASCRRAASWQCRSLPTSQRKVMLSDASPALSLKIGRNVQHGFGDAWSGHLHVGDCRHKAKKTKHTPAHPES